MKPTLKTETKLWQDGYSFVCGIDEAGRGAIAGPLVSAAVILDPACRYRYNDSKLLSPKAREKLFENIKRRSIAWSVGITTVEEINQFGIQSATYMSYERAYKSLKCSPDFLLIDHYRLPGTIIPQLSITKGDKLSQSIAAASIVAKVTRDMMILECAKKYKEYKLEKHMGYGTKFHLEIVQKLGPSPIHRVNFIDKSDTIKLNLL